MNPSKFIDRIRIKNFKSFVDETFDFPERFTVVIGDNGMGKTALLDAIAVMAGTWTKGFDNGGYREIGDDEIRRVEYTRSQVELQLPVQIEGFRKTSLGTLKGWKHVRKAPGAHNRITNWHAMWFLNDAEQAQQAARQGGEIVLPVVVYYDTNRLVPDKGERQGKHKKVEYQIRGPRDEGYKNAFRWTDEEREDENWLKHLNNDPKESDDRNIFLSWYKTLEDEWNKFKDPQDEAHMQAFKAALQQIVPAWEEVYFSNREDDLVGFMQARNGEKEWLPFRMLSDGYRNMVSLVADIAYRCIKLNPHLGRNAVIQTPGIVLIDEIDLHLHPKWQKNIVKDLKRAFPLVQFIVTTHSPFIVQSLKTAELINLNEEESTATTDPFRQSIEEVAEEEMRVPDVERSQRFKDMQATAARYFSLIRHGQTSANSPQVRALKEELDILESRYNDDPAYVALLQAERNSASL